MVIRAYLLFLFLSFSGFAFAQGNCQVDRINSLLASEDRVGFGGNTTGGSQASKFTVVKNTNDSGPGSLREAIFKRENDPDRFDPVWVVFDKSLDGKTIYLDRGISTFQKNLTIDGRGDNGMLDITISPSASAVGTAFFQFRGGNTIVHGITIDGLNTQSIGLMLRQGDDYWLDHLTITGFEADDAISIGQGGRADSTSEVTISNYKSYNTDKAILTGANPNYPNVRFNRGTILKSELAARERNPRMGFNGQWHMYNNYVHSVRGGSGIDVNYGTQLIASNNVVSGLGAKAPHKLISGRNAGTHPNSSQSPVGHVYTSGNILLHGAGEDGSINPTNPKAYKIPYSFQMMPASQVVDYVQKNAGAKNASGSIMLCNGQLAPKPTTTSKVTTNSTNTTTTTMKKQQSQAPKIAPATKQTSGSTNKSITNKHVLIDLKRIKEKKGFSYRLNQDLGGQGNNPNARTRSTVRVFEDGVELGPAHSRKVRKLGKGRFNHWYSSLYFSSSDNTDPRKNGRVYTFTTDTSAPQKCVDVDGDGWGWNGVKSCIMPKVKDPAVEKATSSTGGNGASQKCVDVDGDGWGWDGVKSCIMPTMKDPAIKKATSSKTSTTSTTAPTKSKTPTTKKPVSNTTSSRRLSLLNSPWKIGFGAATTGAGLNGSLYVVKNTNDSGPGSLRDGLSKPNTWVIYDPSLDGKTIYINSSLRPAANTTWDGRDALVRIAPKMPLAKGITLVRYYEDNSIMHRVLIGPDKDLSIANIKPNLVTAVLISEGKNYWIDHVEIFNTDDDSIGIGNGSTKSAVDVTVTHYKVYSASKGLLLGQDKAKSQNAGKTGRVTVAWSDFSAKCRNFRNSGANWAHGFNNYSHDYGGDTCGTIAGHGDKPNRDGTDTPVILAESSVFEDSNLGLYGDLSGPSTISGLPVQGYIFTDGKNIFKRGSGQNNFVIDPGDKNISPVSKPVPPYSYPKMDSSKVQAYVLDNAGVHGKNIIYPSSP